MHANVAIMVAEQALMLTTSGGAAGQVDQARHAWRIPTGQ
jgi:hypothetical protein